MTDSDRMERLKKSIKKSEALINKFQALDKKMFDYMYSKLNDFDKKHIDKLTIERRNILI